MLRSRQDDDLAFVVFLACPCRGSKFKAISISSSSFSPHHALLRSHLLFYSKTQADAFSPNPIIIQQFDEIPAVGPVALLNSYLNLTKALCRDKAISRPDQLWIGILGRPLSTNTIRQWVRDIIFLGDPNANKKGANAHSIRSQVATHLLVAGLPIKRSCLL